MTPLQFAKQECSNYAPDGSCKGIGINDDGSIFSFGVKPACVLGPRGAKCRYFEECVLPMGIEPSNARNVIRAKERDQAVKIYSQIASKSARASGNICPECRQREVEPPKRFCYQCAEARQARRNRTRGKKT